MMHVRLLAAAALVLAVSAGMSAQTYLGGLRGTIRDRDGVIGEAVVQLVEDDTGLTRNAVSSATGDFVFASMPPGAYSLRASHPGFKRYSRGGLLLGTQTAMAVDIILEAGALSELVTVFADSPLLERTSASVSTLLDLSELERLPTPGRNVFFIATTTPTVVASGDSQFVRQQDQSNSSLISLGGGPRRNNGYLLDGIPIVDIQNRATFIPSLQAVGEMRVQLNAYDAQIGRTSGGVFNTVARTGSNTWHGRGLYQDRPSWGTAQLFFADKANLPSTPTYYHLYGGGAGGPIIKDRTFFWTSTEGYRSRTRRNTVLRLPTALERLGDFSQSAFTLYDPLTTRADPMNPTQFIRDAFPGNRIPAARLNPVATELLHYLPLPINGSARPAEASIVDAADQITAKLTHKWSASVVSNALYAWYQSHEPDARFFGGQLFENGADPGDGALVRWLHLLTMTTMWTPGSRSVVELRYGSHRFVDHNKPAPFNASSLGFSAGFLESIAFSKFPSIGVADYGNGGTLLGDRSHERSSYVRRSR